jgi:hypothetical protein
MTQNDEGKPLLSDFQINKLFNKLTLEETELDLFDFIISETNKTKQKWEYDHDTLSQMETLCYYNVSALF